METEINYYKLVNKSFTLLRRDKKILLVPIFSFFLIIFLLAVFVVCLYFFTDLKFLFSYAKEFGQEAAMMKANFYAIIAVVFLYLVGGFVNMFSNAILVRWAYSKLDGKTLSISECIKEASIHTKKLFIWGLVWGAVSFMLRLLRNQYRRIPGYRSPETIGFSFMGVFWNFASYFILQALLFENKKVKEAVVRSAIIFSKTWVKNVTGQLSIGFRLLPWILISVAPFIVVLFVSFTAPEILTNLEHTLDIDVPMLSFVFAFIWMITVIAITGIIFLTLQQIFFTVIYYYYKKEEERDISVKEN